MKDEICVLCIGLLFIFYKGMLSILVNKGLYLTRRRQNTTPSTYFVSVNTKLVKIRFLVF